MSLLSSYTWSKSIDDASGSGGLAETGGSQDNYNFNAERGLSAFDRKHRLTFAYLWELPVGGRASGLAAGVVRGWQLNGIFTASSGQPFTAALGIDNSLTGNFNDRPDVIGDSKISNPDPARWFNTSAFVIPARGTFGNAGRNSLRGPGLVNLDVAMFKNFVYRGIPDFVQFRAEFFNVANHPQFLLPNKNAESPQFGTISRARDARQIQLSLRIRF